MNTRLLYNKGIMLNTLLQWLSLALIIASIFWLVALNVEGWAGQDGTETIRSGGSLALGCLSFLICLFNRKLFRSTLIDFTILLVHFYYSATFFFSGLIPSQWPYGVKNPELTVLWTFICFIIALISLCSGIIVGERVTFKISPHWSLARIADKTLNKGTIWFLIILGIVQTVASMNMGLGNLKDQNAGANIAWIFSIISPTTIMLLAQCIFIYYRFVSKRDVSKLLWVSIFCILILQVFLSFLVGNRSSIVAVAMNLLFCYAACRNFSAVTFKSKLLIVIGAVASLSFVLFPLATFIRSIKNGTIDLTVLEPAIEHLVSLFDSRYFSTFIEPAVKRLSNFGYMCVSVGAFLFDQMPVNSEVIGFQNFLKTAINQMVPTDPFDAIPTQLTPSFVFGMRPLSDYRTFYFSEPYTFVGIAIIFTSYFFPLYLIGFGFVFGTIYRHFRDRFDLFSVFCKVTIFCLLSIFIGGYALEHIPIYIFNHALVFGFLLAARTLRPLFIGNNNQIHAEIPKTEQLSEENSR
jgi:hypothetical protein